MLNLYDYKNLKCNFHTHTTRCNHAVGTEREYVERAIEGGFQVLGFSDHAPYFFEKGHVSRIRMGMEELEGYVKTIEDLQKEYKKEIQIFKGLELEYFPNKFEQTLAEIENYPLDYLILGQHYLNGDIERHYVGQRRTEEIWLEIYVNQVIEGIETGKFLYVAHPDIINYEREDAVYDRYMTRLAKRLKAYHMPVELNVNGCRKEKSYPRKRFIELAEQEGCDFIIGVDAHVPNELIDFEHYQKCEKMVSSENLFWN